MHYFVTPMYYVLHFNRYFLLFVVVVTVDSRPVQLNLCDTAGQVSVARHLKKREFVVDVSVCLFVQINDT